uniref:Uncharacterized protein LOC102800609 n=1 Tax=Saccoglossus kowalevskii TaxID=10224 RepID=A0ABM0MWJ8_SACKO|nr:PREDICTED: uncharacterized protein LOC102800609 [Saccoglossus kowalevskii]
MADDPGHSRTGSVHPGDHIPDKSMKLKSTCKFTQRQLFKEEPLPVESEEPWIEEEDAALVEFISLYQEKKKIPWQAPRNKDFWNKCALAIAHRTKLPQKKGK